jgi:hypothetical protein
MLITIGASQDATLSEFYINPDKLRQAQRADPSLAPILQFLEHGIMTSSKKKMYRALKDIAEYLLVDGILYHIYTPPGKHAASLSKQQIVVPQNWKATIIKHCHDIPISGHTGILRTYLRCRERFYFRRMQTEVVAFVKSCKVCLKGTPIDPTSRPYLNPIKPHDFLRRLHLDIYSPRVTSRGYNYLLLIIDSHSKLGVLGVLKKQTAKAIAKIIIDKWICVYGLLEPAFAHTFVSDNGANLVGNINTELCRMLQIKRVTTTFYHAAGNGLVERRFRDITTMLNKLTLTHPRSWVDFIPMVQAALNSSICETTGYSAFELLTGENLSFPTDQQLKEGFHTPVSAPETVQDWKCRLNCIRDLAKQNTIRAQIKQAHYYNKKSRPQKFTVGSKVMVHTPRFALDEESRKMHEHYTGEFEIVQLLGTTNAQLRSLSNDKLLPYSVHLSKLRLIRPRPEHLTDLESEPISENKLKTKQVTTLPSEEDMEEVLALSKPRTRNQALDAPGQDEGTMTYESQIDAPSGVTMNELPTSGLPGFGGTPYRSVHTTNGRSNSIKDTLQEPSAPDDQKGLPNVELDDVNPMNTIDDSIAELPPAATEAEQAVDDSKYYPVKRVHYGMVDPDTKETSYYVSWKSFPKKYNQYVKAEDLSPETQQKLIDHPPKMIMKAKTPQIDNND